MWAYWPITLFWKTFGVFPVSFNNRQKIPIFFTLFLLFSCIYVFFSIPSIICKIGIECTSDSVRILKQIYPEVVNIMSMLSRIALLYSVRFKFKKYKETLENYETYSPTVASEVRCYKMFTFLTVSMCLLIVPANVARVALLYYEQADRLVIMLYVFIYVQNLTMCCSETQFAEQCYVLYRKFRQINDEIAALGGLLIDLSGYAAYYSLRRTGVIRHGCCCTSVSSSSTVIIATVDTSCCDSRYNNKTITSDVSRTVANTVETLRVRHWLLREAIGSLKGLFSIQLGMSVCVLCVMLFFDIYYETFHVMGEFTLSTLIIYFWLFQYAVRYIGIILISHYTTKQVISRLSYSIGHRYTISID